MKRNEVKPQQQVAYASHGRREDSRQYARLATVIEVLTPEEAYRAARERWTGHGPFPYWRVKDARKQTVQIVYQPRKDAEPETAYVEPRELWSTWEDQEKWLVAQKERERVVQERAAVARASRAKDLAASAAAIEELAKAGVRAAPAPYPSTGIVLSARQAEKLATALFTPEELKR